MGQTKSRFEEFARERFFGSRLFPAARDTYQRIFNRDKLTHRRDLASFYSAFIRPGDLVFDVGANVGVYSEVFAGLGATVVAIEPNPRCLRVLEKLSERCPIRVEACAVGDAPGRMVLQVSENHCLSALAPTVAAVAVRSPLHGAARWNDSLEVEVKTLDVLAAAHGTPSFVKIDAEGFDDRVLAGMSFAPQIVSFEYYKYLPDVAQRCISASVFNSGYEFNYVQGIALKLATPTWMSSSDLRGRLESLAANGLDYGDVMVRKVTRSSAAAQS